MSIKSDLTLLDSELIDQFQEEAGPEPEVPKCQEWWTKNIDKTEPLWKLKALRAYSLFLSSYPYVKPKKRKRLFEAQFIDTYGPLFSDKLLVKHGGEYSVWTLKFTYFMHIYYFLHAFVNEN